MQCPSHPFLRSTLTSLRHPVSLAHPRPLHTTPTHLSHSNPLGLPKSGTPPTLSSRRGPPSKRPIASARKVIAISSAKGGVGKSTIAANLALAFARQGRRAGILDTDIFGPSVPTLFGLQDASEPRLSDSNRLVPLTNYGVQTMSMGFLVPRDAAVVWRGLMVVKALQQLLHEVEWAPLDVLVLDMPPGTGDTQLTICQEVQIDGAVIVSTPQSLALADATRGVAMFKKVDVPIAGMVQNMSVFVCPHCSTATHIFGSEGVRRECEKLGVEHLGDVPLDAKVCEDADRGRPTLVSEPGSQRAKVFEDMAQRIGEIVGL